MGGGTWGVALGLLGWGMGADVWAEMVWVEGRNNINSLLHVICVHIKFKSIAENES
jgi:hypothetical protein